MTDDISKVVQYRKRPVVIEAVQWHKPGDHPKVERFLDTAEGIEKWSRVMANAWGDHATEFHGIQTLEGTMRVSPGDWIIKGVKGEFYPCKPDIFAATYEPAAHPSRGVVDERRLIGWRTGDYLWETTDRAVALNWLGNVEVLPIFEGDPNTKLKAAALPAVPEGMADPTQGWRVEFVCCGREDGHATAATWAEADAIREAYTSGVGVNPHGYSYTHAHDSGHQRAAIVKRATPAHDQPEGEG